MKNLKYNTISSGNVNITTGAKFPVKEWTIGIPVEDEARNQLLNVANMPFVFKHVSAMPDVHAGMGATIGSVIPTVGAVIPAAIGVDIGCGVINARTTLTANDLPDNLSGIRSAIESFVPHGRTDNGGPNDRGAWGNLPKDVSDTWSNKLLDNYNKIISNHPKAKPMTSPEKHLGTLGIGNHFIEICLDENDCVWIMLHSGSRGAGNRLGSYFIQLAKKEMERWFINLPDKNLAYLPEGSDYFNDYMDAVGWAQKYALVNREMMLNLVIKALNTQKLPEFSVKDKAINCHHNYVTRENHFGKNVLVTRKGAICARKGMAGIIPGSMGAKSYIVEGLGNKDSFESASHGAGRVMSRTAAKKTFSLEDHKKAVAGIECRVDSDIIDETPAAYKDIDDVMDAQKDLVKIKHTLKQIICVKG